MNEVAFVAASAGTGKTYRVVTEVVAAITAGAIAPEALVATTFSRRAAASLRAALDRRLREVGRHDDALGPVGGNAHCSERSEDGSKLPEYVEPGSFVPKAVLNLLALEEVDGGLR